MFWYIIDKHSEQKNKITWETNPSGEINLVRYIGLSRLEAENYLGFSDFGETIHENLVDTKLRNLLSKSKHLDNKQISKENVLKSRTRNIYYLEVSFPLGNELFLDFKNACEKFYKDSSISKDELGVSFDGEWLELPEKLKKDIDKTIKIITTLEKEVSDFFKN